MSQRLQPSVVALNTPVSLPAFGGLTIKQSAFLDNFLSSPTTVGNGTKSVIAAGYTDDTASAAVIASQLLRSFKVKQEIKRRLGKAVASGEEVLELLTKHARADLTDVLTPEGAFDFRRARSKRVLKKLKVKTDKDGSVTHEYEIHDPQVALDKLARFHKLLTDKVETESTLSSNDIDRLGQSLLAAMTEAAQRMRAAEAQPVAQLAESDPNP